MNIGIRILESDNTIAIKILNALKPELNKVFNKAVSKIEAEIQKSLISALKQEPEYGQLISGILRTEFGIEDTSNVEAIVEKMAQTTKARALPVSVVGKSLKGGIVIEAIQSDNISNIIYADEAYVFDRKGYSMPWLEWLLLRGNSVLVKGYEVKYGPSPFSRSGNGIMVNSNQDWRVPPEYKGTAGDNWTTRAISRLDREIVSIIKRNIEKSI
tara:strand:+ start:287 stop:928 length:642 start_codon:yes stop_codon:yes gene_type:complete